MESKALVEVQAPRPERWVGVPRISREDEGAKSLENQAAHIGAAAEAADATLVAMLHERNVSGGNSLDHRRGLGAAVEMIENGEAEVLVLSAFDRWHRSMPVQYEVMARVHAANGKIVPLDYGGEVRDDTASEWLRAHTTGGQAEYYRRLTREKTIAANRLNVDRGVVPGHLPFYLKQRGKDDKVAVRDERRVKLAVEVIEMRLAGRTLKETREFLRRRGVKISASTMQSLFGSRLLLGEIHYTGHVNDHAFDPLIEEDTFNRLQVIRLPRGRRPNSARLLARLQILRCETCGSPMQVGTSKGTYPTYHCPTSVECSRRAAISAVKAEQIVSDYTRARLEGLRERITKDGDLAQADRDVERARAKLDAVIETFDELQTDPAVKMKLRTLSADLEAATGRRDHLRDTSGPAAFVLDAYRDWDDLSADGRRALIRAVVASVTVRPGRVRDKIASITPVS